MSSESSTTKTYLALAVLSAGMLTYEINLTRLYAVQQFHNFAFLVVGLAVMGLGASGLALSLWPRHPPLNRLAGLYSLSIAASFLISNWLPFDSYSIAWDRRQVAILALYFLAAAAPFFLAGMVSGACLAMAGEDAHLPYAAVFIGSALGCPLALVIHSFAGALAGMGLALILGWLAGALLAASSRERGFHLIAAAISLALMLWHPAALEIQLSPYKPLYSTRLAPDARPALTDWSSAARVDVVTTASVHQFPGLSLNADVELPKQTPMFLDGDGPYPITKLLPDEPASSELASSMPGWLAYQLRSPNRTLILDPGAGLHAQLALAAGSGSVGLTSDQPLMLQVLSGPLSSSSAGLLLDPRIEIRLRSTRGALRSVNAPYDVIELSLSDPYRPVTSGAFSLTENYTLTVEALGDIYANLSPDGLLVLTRWLSTPPSESARAWSTLLAALRHDGAVGLPDRLIAFRSMRTATMMASPTAFTSSELAAAREFFDRNAFDAIYLPDLGPEEVNRYNRLPEPIYSELFHDLLIQPESTIREYPFNILPTTDDRPYFFHYFRWGQTPEVLATLGRTWQPFGGSGYFVLLALLALTLAIAVPLAVTPLLVTRDPTAPHPGLSSLAYFAALGSGYLLLEIPLIQRFTLLLDQPALSLATVLFTLLLASGIGSLLSTRLGLRTSLLALVGLAGLLALIVPPAVSAAVAWPLSGRVGIAIAIMAAPGLLMGVPFAAGLRLLERRSPGMIPWAWAVNGAASGVTGVAAALIALDLGMRADLIAGGIMYGVAWFTAARL